MFRSVLVANRGEIAVRIIRTLRRLGIRAVLVASLPDRGSLAARDADEVVLLSGATPRRTYLDAEAILRVAAEAGCDAIHPGYGFLSESPDFAERCQREGIAFVGPPPEVLRVVGDKLEAKRLAQSAGLPVIPGAEGGTEDPAGLIQEARRLGLPLMIKARGGGGGRGMRTAESFEDLEEQLQSAGREAAAAFGDGRLLLERLITDAHHVEVQVIGDGRGRILQLGERDCSVQRRRQKLIEETPSPIVDAELRRQIGEASLRMAKSIGYVNAGTFEFLVPVSGEGPPREYFFLEVNPRLQVEHPVTEEVTGLDLVELQLRVAAGEALPLSQEDVRSSGHAIEFRINAESPRDDFRPAGGRLAPADFALERLGLAARVDTGYGPNDVIPAEYDSLLAKLIVRGDTREEALERAACALERSRPAGVPTNVDLHLAILDHPDFRNGAATIDWLERQLQSLLQSAAIPDTVWIAAAAALLAPNRPLGPLPARVWLSARSETRQVDLSFSGPADGRACQAGREWRKFAIRGRTVVVDGAPHEVRVTYPTVTCTSPAGVFRVSATKPFPLPRRQAGARAGSLQIAAPLAGRVISLAVREGDSLAAGDLVAIIEAMKLEHRVVAPAAGVVARVHAAAGEVLQEGGLLVELTAEGD